MPQPIDRRARSACGSRTACARTWRSSGTPAGAGPRPTNICLKTGSAATARGPELLSSVGTSRQPSTLLPLLGHDPLDSARPAARRLVVRQEHQPGAVRALGGQRDPQPVGLLAEETIRHLDQDAGAVAGVGFAAAGAAMLQVDEHLQRVADDGVRAAALGVHDEADAAGVVLMTRVVEAVSGGWLGVGTAFMGHPEAEEKRILLIVSMRSACARYASRAWPPSRRRGIDPAALTALASTVLRWCCSWRSVSPSVVAAPRRARVVAPVRCRRPAGEKPRTTPFRPPPVSLPLRSGFPNIAD